MRILPLPFLVFISRFGIFFCDVLLKFALLLHPEVIQALPLSDEAQEQPPEPEQPILLVEMLPREENA